MQTSSSITIRRRRILSLAAISMAASADLSRAQLTVATFGTGYDLATAANYSPNTPPTASVLADVTTVQATNGTSTSLSLTTTTTATTVTLGALAFDLSAGSGINLDSSSNTSNAASNTLTLAGGNTGTTTPATSVGDLITLTSNVNGLVDIRGNNGGITLNLPSTGGNFNVAGGSTLEFDAGTTNLAGTGSH